MYSSTNGPTTTSSGTMSQAGTCCIKACSPAWFAEVSTCPFADTTTVVRIIMAITAAGTINSVNQGRVARTLRSRTTTWRAARSASIPTEA